MYTRSTEKMPEIVVNLDHRYWKPEIEKSCVESLVVVFLDHLNLNHVHLCICLPNEIVTSHLHILLCGLMQYQIISSQQGSYHDVHPCPCQTGYH